jgi:hypothetical protein
MSDYPPKSAAMNTSITPLFPDSLWSVLFKDNGHWRVGIYRPECGEPDDIDILERHTCPELFVCLGGRMGIVVGTGAEERIAEMEPNQALLVMDYHNGFAIDPSGYFLVVEHRRAGEKSGSYIRRAR